MKPYFAILFDSLLESVRSKVLWILLLSWTLIIAAIFPLAITSGESYAVSFASFSNRESAKTIMDQLASASAGKGSRAQKAIYAKLDSEFQSLLQQRQKNKRRIAVGILIESLNKVLKIDDLYDPQVWPTAIKRPDIQPLIEKESRSASETEHLNRRLLDLTFQGNFSQANGQAAWIAYAGIKLGGALPFTEKQIRPFIETAIFPLVMRIGLGVVAMFVAIIITSPMIPDMFQTGSLHLLLSKPLSRSLLFLTKFLGGCIFVAINILFVLIGLYLYAGIQLKIWNAGILWCFPLFIFVFMIFYSVSALVGLIWKNPIICVVITAVFWGVCFTIGLIHAFIDVFANLQPQTVRIVSVGDQVITTSQLGLIRYWNPAKSQWQTAYGEQGGRKILGPVWLPSQKSIFFARVVNAPFGIATGESVQIEFAHAPELLDPEDKSFNSAIWEDSRMDSGPELPVDAQQILPWRDTFVVLNENGIYRFNPEAMSKGEEFSIPFLNLPLAAPSSTAFPMISPLEWGLKRPMDLTVTPQSNRLITFSKSKLTIWDYADEKLTSAGTVDVDIPPETVVSLAANEQYAIVCPNGETPIVINLETLSVEKRFEKIGKISARQIRVSSQGEFALLTNEGNIWLVDAKVSDATHPSLPGQSHGLALHFTETDNLWVAHSVRKADLWDLKEKKSIQSIRPYPSVTEFVFNFAMHPFYVINPKPAAVNDTIEYVLKNPENNTIALDRSDLENGQLKSDPWQPLWSNAIFITVLLGLGCWYLYRQDL